MDFVKAAKKTEKTKKKTKGMTKPKSKTSVDKKITKTKDDKMGFNMYLGNLHHSITDQDLRNYFCSYKIVKSMEIHKKGNKKYGLIYFKDATSAEVFCDHKVHYICKRKVILRLSDRWKQKYCGRVAKCTKENDPKEVSVFHLNDDCLLHLFSFLSLHDMINLSNICERFHGIVDALFYYRKSLNVSEEQQLTFEELDKFLVNAGHHIHHFKFVRTTIKWHPIIVLKLIAQKCPNLREIYICSFQYVNTRVFNRNCLNFLNLTKLQLIRCNITDDICKTLTVLQNVEHINFSDNKKLTGKYLDEFPKLIQLNLKSCLGIQKEFFIRICNKGLLQILTTNNTFKIYDDNLSETLLKLTDLKDLRIDRQLSDNAIKNLNQLEKLKSLTIIFPVIVEIYFVVEVVKSMGNKLEGLSLIGTIESHSGNQIVEAICRYGFRNLRKLCLSTICELSDSFVQRLSELKQLKQLGFKLCDCFPHEDLLTIIEQSTQIEELCFIKCPQITNAVIFEIGKRIKERETKSRCIIYVTNSGVSREIFKDKKYIEYSPFVKVSFKHPSFMSCME